MPQKRLRRRRRRSPREGRSSRRRRDEEGASLSAPVVESDSSSMTSGAPAPELLDEPPAREYESRYHEILASRLAQLPLPACADEEGPNLPSDETVEALVRSSFYDDELRAALVEYQAHKLLSRPDDVHGRDGDSGEVDSSSSLMDDITEEEFSRDREVLSSRRHEIDHTEAELEEEEADRLSHKYARYRLKACLGGDEYESWSEYREFYSTPGTDRDYLLYWDTIVKDLKWIEEHVLKSFSEWHELHEKASCQAVRIAARFTNIHPRLAYYGFLEYKQSTRFYLKFVKDLDYVFFEIWKLVNRQICFRDAMQHVYEENPFPLRKRELERELSRSGSFRLEEQFRRCTEGISKEVPEWIARKLISQEVRFKCALPKTYAQYARKKLKIAEVIGLIPKAEIQA
ncbi:uncharacterized protein [Triticum aestivum]|uniref:uncharacterized protein isoform X2 n=1 Tax=Triticum aestivum TaxID=4565 RepID=UPI001D022D67|nr:uncharacterized protein LOC123059554 isoform X2 [Triticum aestivum]